MRQLLNLCADACFNALAYNFMKKPSAIHMLTAKTAHTYAERACPLQINIQQLPMVGAAMLSACPDTYVYAGMFGWSRL
jgi:hypothetical protein